MMVFKNLTTKVDDIFVVLFGADEIYLNFFGSRGVVY